jgi:hypothetical protein
VCKLKLNAINHLDSEYKSGDDWVRIASSVQAWVVVHWENPQRLEPIRVSAHLIPINAPPAEDCTLEAMRTRACANQCVDFKRFLFAQSSTNSMRSARVEMNAIGAPDRSASRLPQGHRAREANLSSHG